MSPVPGEVPVREWTLYVCPGCGDWGYSPGECGRWSMHDRKLPGPTFQPITVAPLTDVVEALREHAKSKDTGGTSARHVSNTLDYAADFISERFGGTP